MSCCRPMWRACRRGACAERARLAAFAAVSLALHGGLLMAFWKEPVPLASIGMEVISVEIVVGATAPAGVAATPGEQQVQAAAAPDTEATDTDKADEKATAQPQAIEVAKEEAAPEQKAEQPKAEEAKPEEPKFETAAAPEEPRQAEQKPAVAMVETPAPEIATAKPQETPPPPTEVTLLPQPEEKPVETKPEPKPVQAAPPKPVKDAKPAKEPRRIAAPTREKSSREAKASTPSTAANNVGVGRSDNDTNYPGLVSAHLRRYQQYPLRRAQPRRPGHRHGSVQPRRRRPRDVFAPRARLGRCGHRPGGAGYGAARVTLSGAARRAGAQLHRSDRISFELTPQASLPAVHEGDVHVHRHEPLSGGQGQGRSL